MEEFVTIEENVDYTLTEKKSKFIANLIREKTQYILKIFIYFYVFCVFL